MNKKIDSITETLGELYDTIEAEMMLKTNIGLVKGMPRIAVRNELERTKSKALGDLNLVTKRLGELVGTDVVKIDYDNKKTTGLLLQSADKHYAKADAKVQKVKSVDKLRGEIFKQTQAGIAKGLKVTYKNGRQMGYKEYMEMNVRTTVAQEVGSMQLVSGKMAGIVFYITNHFADCADDHKDYQGKIYYDERYKSFGYDKETLATIENKISSSKLLGVQTVREQKPYFTTRPNCRHTFTPISIQQAVNDSPKSLVKDLKLSTGTYKDDNYKLMQEQRFNERQIRKYKSRMMQNEELARVSGDTAYTMQAAKDRVLTSRWQKHNRLLVKNNPVLSRDYRRETRDILLQDLGVRYNPTVAAEELKVETPIRYQYNTPSNFKNSKLVEKSFDLWVNKLDKEQITNKRANKFLSRIDKHFDRDVTIKSTTDGKYAFSYGYSVSSKKIIDTKLILPALDKLDIENSKSFTHEVTHALEYSYTTKAFEKANIDYRYNNGLPYLSNLHLTKPDVGNDVFLNKALVVSEKLTNSIDVFDVKYSNVKDFINNRSKEVVDILDKNAKIVKDYDDALHAENEEIIKKYQDKEIDYDEYKKQFNVLKKKSKSGDTKKKGYGAVSDIYDAITNGLGRDSGALVSGHGAYFRKKQNRNIEIYAEYMQLSIHDPDLLDAVRKDIPDIIKACDEIADLYNELGDEL